MSSSRNNTLQIGDVHITALSDGSITFDPRILFPKDPLDVWEPYHERFPEYFEGELFKNNLGSFVFTSQEKHILADTGFGPNGKMLGHHAPGQLLRDFSKNGIKLDSIDTVFLTHLHGDHVGWNLREDLEDRRLSFPNARYRVHEADWKHFTTNKILNDENRGKTTKHSVIPVHEQGALDLMNGETELAPGVVAFHTPGHTPGHMSLLISSRNQRAVLVGDILGSPMQASETELSYSPDWNQKMGIEARNNILDQAETSNSIVIGSHLSFPGWGKIIRWEGRRYWKAL